MKQKLTPAEVIAFLSGAGELDGCSFGEKPAGARGNFWWRKYLPLLVAPTSTAPSQVPAHPADMRENYDAGVRDERARVVAWLKRYASLNRAACDKPAHSASPAGTIDLRARAACCSIHATWIELGKHEEPPVDEPEPYTDALIRLESENAELRRRFKEYSIKQLGYAGLADPSFLATSAIDGREGEAWRDIETAPKVHGQMLLGINRYGAIDTICWNDSIPGWDDGFGHETMDGDDGHVRGFDANYWQPLPAPPAIRALGNSGQVA